MSACSPEWRCQAYKIECEGGLRYIVYNTSAIGNPTDHTHDKWYAHPYPAPLPLWEEVGEAFDTPEEAERSVRVLHVRADGRVKRFEVLVSRDFL